MISKEMSLVEYVKTLPKSNVIYPKDFDFKKEYYKAKAKGYEEQNPVWCQCSFGFFSWAKPPTWKNRKVVYPDWQQNGRGVCNPIHTSDLCLLFDIGKRGWSDQGDFRDGDFEIPAIGRYQQKDKQTTAIPMASPKVLISERILFRDRFRMAIWGSFVASLHWVYDFNVDLYFYERGKTIGTDYC